MRRFFNQASLSGQFIFLTAACLIVIGGGTILVVDWVTYRRQMGPLNPEELASLRLQVTGILCIISLAAVGLVMAAVRGLLLRPLHRLRAGMDAVIAGDYDEMPLWTGPNRDWRQIGETFEQMVVRLRQARNTYQQAQSVLAHRTSTVDRLLDFSQTIQGAGASEQIITALAQFLETELKLAGVVILSHEPREIPAIKVRCARPSTLVLTDAAVAELNPALCPCFRQNLPRQFHPASSPIRCAIDTCLALPQTHPAYCIPFNVGPARQIVVHMLLPPGQPWTDERCQLARTYVNSAVSSLISLHLLAEAEKQSMTDSLTGLYNRRSMDQLLQREIALAERHKLPLSLVMLDLDHFKEINDTHGHAAGDHLLKSFAECVSITLRKTDLAFRYGGDEFVIVLPQTPISQAEPVVHKLRQAFAAVDFSHAITHLEHQPTLSIGVAERLPASNILTMENLLSAADQALYEAKTQSRNCVRIYHPAIKAAS